MKVKATKPHTPRRWRPLSQNQLNAIDCLLSGMNDTETAADPRVDTCRQTIWDWRMRDPIFQAELQQRRASLWGSTRERLRGLMGKAVENIAASVESGDVGASWNLLKAVGLFGDGTGNAVPGAHIDMELRHRAENQARAEQDALNDNGLMSGALERMNFSLSQRTEEILQELMDEYSEP